MPSFRFRGFVEASAVALSVAQGAQAVAASMTWGQPGGGGQPNGSFTISRVDSHPLGEEIAPFACWLRATNLTGFSVSEPPGDTNVYDPTQHQITYVWELPDEGYQPILTPNIPDPWKSFTTDYGKQIAAVFTTPGVKTVRCFAFDEAGNWGVAEHVFGPGGQSNIIQDPEVFFLNRTVYVSQAGNWEGVPAGVPTANRVTSLSAAATRVSQLPDRLNRVLYRRGEEWLNAVDAPIGHRSTDTEWGGGAVGAFGNPALPRPRFIHTNTRGPFGFSWRERRYCLLSDVEIIGPWDAATETGRAMEGNSGPGSAWYQVVSVMLVHRVKWSGWDNLGFNRESNVGKHRVFHDTEVTNWKNFGTIDAAEWQAWIWCDWHQHPDALMGCNLSENGNSNSVQMGNGHGPFRGQPTYMHVSRSSFFSRNGWSGQSDTSFNTVPPTAGQPCLRFSGGPQTKRCYLNITMNSFEGTGDMMRHAFFNGEHINDQARNWVYDRNLFCATANTSDGFFNANYAGFTVRNNYALVPNVEIVPRTNNGRMVGAVFGFGINEWGGSMVFNDAASTPDRVYNNTAVWLGAQTNFNGSSNVNPVPVITGGQNARRGPLTAENNIVVALDFAQPVGASFAPMVSRPLAGFTPRFKGNRWNFPPIGLSPSGIVITVGEAKVLDGGTNSNVLDGEWLAVPYPNYTGKCRGALDIPLNGQGAAGLRALILANASRKHEVSVTTHPTKRMTDPALYPTGVGGVTFEFAADRIRIRNITGATWAAGSRIVVKLDLSDYLMGFAPGTASPAAIPLLVPGVGSQGRVSEREGLWAHDDFFGVVRPQATARGAVHF